jgi:hypothetical protein
MANKSLIELIRIYFKAYETKDRISDRKSAESRTSSNSVSSTQDKSVESAALAQPLVLHLPIWSTTLPSSYSWAI